MREFNYILGGDSVTVFIDGNSYSVNKQAKTYNLLIDAIRRNDTAAVRQAVDVRKNIADSLTKMSDKVKIVDSQIFYGDTEVTGLISSRIFEMLRLNLDIKPMVKFIENLMQNPSYRAVKEAFGFMEACSLPLTEDGCFLAYKRVRSDYKSVHDGKTDNSIGKVLEMPRNLVDEDASRTCSAGLHFCSYSYLAHFSGERIVVLKINPRDIVAIPEDYNNSKGRACRYEVVGEIEVNEYNKLPVRELDVGYTEDFNDSEGDPDEFDRSDEIEEDVDVDAVLSPSGMTLRKLRSIRQDLQDGETYASIASRYGISSRQVGRIDRGEAWANLS